MDEFMQLGLSMLVIGMTTVFFILFFVVAGGNIIIKITNKYFSEVQEITGVGEGENDKKKMVAIVATIELLTSGKGKVTSISKISQQKN